MRRASQRWCEWRGRTTAAASSRQAAAAAGMRGWSSTRPLLLLPLLLLACRCRRLCLRSMQPCRNDASHWHCRRWIWVQRASWCQLSTPWRTWKRRYLQCTVRWRYAAALVERLCNLRFGGLCDSPACVWTCGHDAVLSCPAVLCCAQTPRQSAPPAAAPFRGPSGVSMHRRASVLLALPVDNLQAGGITS